MRKYIVCWVEIVGEKYVDHYQAFIDGTGRQNYRQANKLYKGLLDDDTVYTANLTEIIKSTDYAIN